MTFRTFRRTVATLLDESGLTARQIADVLGHARPSMTQDVYMGRGAVSRVAADALGKVMGKR
ncbi:phage integrase family protein [Actinokineospora auranticolor]|uniref:Phage integrase family protein n=1 Tax=Actinokineospora auranticolor TaxID=155976 RepID=A0A2S6GH38_9PSEU|nr:phage integrase family protein [Actinokineospora auranticolor]